MPMSPEETINAMRDALIWCSGSADFGPGGKAHVGFEKIVKPLLCGVGYTMKEDMPMTDLDKPCRMGSVSGAISRVDSGLGRLRGALEGLEKRLAPILGSPVVMPGKSEELKKCSVPLADKIDNIANLVEGLATRVETLTDRVEL